MPTAQSLGGIAFAPPAYLREAAGKPDTGPLTYRQLKTEEELSIENDIPCHPGLVYPDCL